MSATQRQKALDDVVPSPFAKKEFVAVLGPRAAPVKPPFLNIIGGLDR